MPVHVPITAAESGLQRDSVVLTEQVRTLEKSRLYELKAEELLLMGKPYENLKQNPFLQVIKGMKKK